MSVPARKLAKLCSPSVNLSHGDATKTVVETVQPLREVTLLLPEAGTVPGPGQIVNSNALLEERPFCGLPGNPASSAAAFELFVRQPFAVSRGRG